MDRSVKAKEREEFSKIKSAVYNAQTVDDLKVAVLDFMEVFCGHTHQMPGEMQEYGRAPGVETDSPMEG
jgi:hypothetical protein